MIMVRDGNHITWHVKKICQHDDTVVGFLTPESPMPQWCTTISEMLPQREVYDGHQAAGNRLKRSIQASGTIPHAEDRAPVALPAPEHETKYWSEKPLVEQLVHV